MDLISRQILQKELALYPIDDITSEEEAGYNRAINDVQKMVLHLPSAQPERSLWFRIGEICVDEPKGFISAGRAFEKIRELLREAERRTDESD